MNQKKKTYINTTKKLGQNRGPNPEVTHKQTLKFDFN